MGDSIWLVCERCKLKSTPELVFLHGSLIGEKLVCPKCAGVTFHVEQRKES